MIREEAKSCIGTIEMLQRLAYNIHGVMDVIDAANCKKIIKTLEQEPQIRPKGHWIVAKGGSLMGERNGYCSNCKNFYTNDWYVMNYCPNCGAEMSEVEND